MSVTPTFYFSSKKENPKTNIQLTIKDINDVINIFLNSELELPISYNDLNYILKLNLDINFNDRDPIISTNYEFFEKPQDLIIFMNNFKNKIENEVNTELSKVEELEYIVKLKNKKIKEISDLEYRIKNMENLRVKEEEDFKIYKYNQNIELEKYKNNKMNEIKNEQNDILQDMVKKVLKLEEELKIRNSYDLEDVDDREHIKVMEELKNKNKNIQEKISKLEEEEEEKEQEKYKNIILDHENIISFLKNELENISKDEKELNDISEEELSGNNNSKISDLQVKYQPLIPKEIAEDPNNIALNLEEEIYEHLKLIISDKPDMIYTNLIYVITEMMKFVETFYMEGFDKKEFIIESIKKFLIYQNINSPETDFILDTICPELIDILLLVDKRKIIIGRKLNCFIPWCA